MHARHWFRRPRQVVTIFVAVAIVSIAALGGLTWHILKQDRELDDKRIFDRLNIAADRAAAAMERSLFDLETAAGGTADTKAIPAGVAAITIAEDGLSTRVDQQLLFRPMAPAGPVDERTGAVFAEGERLEHVEHDFKGAARIYRSLIAGTDDATRAGALLRLAHAERKAGAIDEALRAYDALALLDTASADGIPAAIAARLGRLGTFADANRPADRDREAGGLLADLQRGGWSISRGMYESYSQEARRWLAESPADDAEAVALAKAAEWLWNSRASLGEGGRRVRTENGIPVLVSWRTRGAHLEAVLAGSSHLRAIAAAAFSLDVVWSLADLDGHRFIGDRPTQRLVVDRTATAGLPWSFSVSFAAGNAVSPGRTPLFMVLGLVAVVIVAGWYFVFRSLGNERQVAELQSNFVAAVSHEFRSPLTALAHAADLLSTDRLPSEPLRREAYGVLTRETARLRGLVDGLLDSDRFGKGSAAFRFEPVVVDTLVVDAVEAFRGHVAPAGYAVELVGHAGGLTVSADREALTRALWNLLDNAVKYSPDCHTVWVEVERTADCVAIGVRDRGIGIPEGEQSAIFERFVRGAVATSERIRGTGLGLALVRQIVEAHGGEVRLASEPGRGSRFTLVLMTERVVASELA